MGSKEEPKKCNPADCRIVDGLCLEHGYSVSETVKCENYLDLRGWRKEG